MAEPTKLPSRRHDAEARPLPAPGRFIAVIGAGFSGALLAIHLLRHAGPNDRIYLFEKEARAGIGLAYGTEDSRHLLNVCASNMSAFPDEPDHFLRWLRNHAPKLGLPRVGPDSFVPRWIFGRYVEELLQNALSTTTLPNRLLLVHKEVVNIEESTKALGIDTSDGHRFHVDAAILATGNTSHCADLAEKQPRASVQAIKPDDDVLLVGTGLSMVDIAVSLLAAGHRGAIHAVSRHGLLPARHPAAAISPLAIPIMSPPSGLSPRALLRWLRAEIGVVEERGGNWRHVVNSLRAQTQSIWAGWTLDERKRFLRHCRSWWDAHRHRMAPEAAETIDQAIAAGSLRVTAGRVIRTSKRGRSIKAEVVERHRPVAHILSVAHVVDCTGIKTDYAAQERGLLPALIANGVARADALQLGLDVDENCGLIDRNGTASHRLFAAGSLTRGTFWEIVAVPDIRVQCARLARHLSVQTSPLHRFLSARK